MRWYTETPFRIVPPRAMVIHPDWDRPLPPAPVAPMEAMRRKLEAAIEAEIRRMLGLWMSECEPGLAWGPEGLLGLTLAGDPGPVRIVVPSRLTTLRDCLSAIEDNSDLSVPVYPPETSPNVGAPLYLSR